MTPRERDDFISWTALGMLAHDVCAFQMPKGTAFGFMLRDALEESRYPYKFGFNLDPDKIIENSIIHSQYDILDARWGGYTDNSNRYCLKVYFVNRVDQKDFQSGESGLRLVAGIRCEETEVTKRTDLYCFGSLMIQKLKDENCSIYTYKKYKQ